MPDISLPIRLRDFIADRDGWLYAVTGYDNTEKAGALLRYVPDANGERVDTQGQRYRKLSFSAAFEHIRQHKPHYADFVQRIPLTDITQIYKPEQQVDTVAARDKRLRKVLACLDLPPGSAGFSGSRLCGLETAHSDIDLVVYGSAFLLARQRLRALIETGEFSPVSDAMWQHIYYDKRQPDIDFSTFLRHEQRKWNRAEIDGIYLDLMHTHDYTDLAAIDSRKGKPLGRITLTAKITNDQHIFEAPAIYGLDHPEIPRIICFTGTYCGQAWYGEMVEARGMLEQYGDERWLVIGTSREARDEYLISTSV